MQDYHSLVGRYKQSVGTVIKVEPCPMKDNFVIVTSDNQSITYLPIDYLEKYFKSNEPILIRWEQRKRRFKNVIIAIIIGGVTCGFLILIIRRILLILSELMK